MKKKKTVWFYSLVGIGAILGMGPIREFGAVPGAITVFAFIGLAHLFGQKKVPHKVNSKAEDGRQTAA